MDTAQPVVNLYPIILPKSSGQDIWGFCSWFLCRLPDGYAKQHLEPSRAKKIFWSLTSIQPKKGGYNSHASVAIAVFKLSFLQQQYHSFQP